MTGAELVFNLAVVLAALVLVLDQKGDRGAGRDRAARAVRENAGEDLDRVGLFALRRVARLAGFSSIEKSLDFLRRERDPGRAPVDDAANRFPMAFAPGGHAKQVAEGVV